jgi:uncharacterized protein (UPF0216 family)
MKCCKPNAKKFLKELLECQECKTSDNGKTWTFCKKHWEQLKQFGGCT